MTNSAQWRHRFDFQIIDLLDVRHMAPKEVAIELGISVSRVYRVSRWIGKRGRNGLVNKLTNKKMGNKTNHM